MQVATLQVNKQVTCNTGDSRDVATSGARARGGHGPCRWASDRRAAWNTNRVACCTEPCSRSATGAHPMHPMHAAHPPRPRSGALQVMCRQPSIRSTHHLQRVQPQQKPTQAAVCSCEHGGGNAAGRPKSCLRVVATAALGPLAGPYAWAPSTHASARRTCMHAHSAHAMAVSAGQHRRMGQVPAGHACLLGLLVMLMMRMHLPR